MMELSLKISPSDAIPATLLAAFVEKAKADGKAPAELLKEIITEAVKIKKQEVEQR